MNEDVASIAPQAMHKQTLLPRHLCGIAMLTGVVAIAATFLSSMMVTKLTHRAESHDLEKLAEEERTYRAHIENMHHLASEMERATAEMIIRANYNLHASQLRGFGLTDQEVRIAVLSVLGETTSAIAKRLFVSESTVRHHLSATYRKTQTKNRQELRKLIHGRIQGNHPSPPQDRPPRARR